jgi:hypothetical protein
MKSWLIAAAAFALCAGSARAQEAPAKDARAPDWTDWSFTGVAENDVFDYSPSHTDRYYTHGTQFSATSGPIPCSRKPWLAEVAVFIEKDEVACRARLRHDEGSAATLDINYRWGLEAGQNIYTPASKQPVPDPKDRPYAGWAYGGVMLGSYSPKEANTIEVQLGVVGPSSGAAWVQDHFHDLIRAARFLGWNHQLRDEVAFDILAERRWRPTRLWSLDPGDPTALALDSTDHLDFALGTVQDSAAAGRAYRLGVGLGADYGPPRIRPAPSGSDFIMKAHDWSAYVFAGLDGRAVARNIFLDGNTFLSSPHVEKRWLVWEATSGAELRWRGLRVGYTYVWQSEEFLGQRGPQRFGSWSVTVLPCAYWKGCGLGL